MKVLFCYLLVALVLLQTLSREVLLVDFSLHRTELAARYCVNKARPQLRCDGRCYFAKLARKQAQRESKAPNSLKEKLEMLLAASRCPVPVAPARWPAAPADYGPYRAAQVPARTRPGVFQPPQA